MTMLPYTEGTLFFVPLRNGGYARGVVARSSRDGKVLLGYFFGPQLSSTEEAGTSTLDPSEAILRIRFGDLGLINGEWPIRGEILSWNRSEWPMPVFVRKDPLGKRQSVFVRYSDADPSHVELESPASDDVGFGVDLMSGYGAVEIKLTKLLGAAVVSPTPDLPPSTPRG
jgi:hypothetical protein